jgi:hypothetical protein
VSASLLIPTEPQVIFEILADVTRHAELDGSGTILGQATGPTRLFDGAEFSMHMRQFFFSLPQPQPGGGVRRGSKNHLGIDGSLARIQGDRWSAVAIRADPDRRVDRRDTQLSVGVCTVAHDHRLASRIPGAGPDYAAPLALTLERVGFRASESMT